MDVLAIAQEIATRVGAFDGLGDSRPDHVLARAAFLVGEEEIVYVDDSLSRSLDSPGWSGDIVIFTANRVVVLTLSDATEDVVSDHGPGDERSSVDAVSWGRARLRAVTLLGTDAGWIAAPDAMPEKTGLRLTYGNGQQVEIPARWAAGAGQTARAGVVELLPSLWDDVAAGS